MDTYLPNKLQAERDQIATHQCFKAQLELAKNHGLDYEFIQSYKKHRRNRCSIDYAMAYAVMEWDI